MLPRSRSIRLVTALAVGVPATACSLPAPAPPVRTASITPVQMRTSAVAPRARTLPVTPMREPTTPEDTTFVVVERAAFASPHLDETSAARVSAQVTRLVTRAGAATSWPERHPTSAELRATRCRGLIIVPAIDELEITRTGAGSEITCAVSLRVAPWHGTDGGERWEAHTTAVATGSARTVTASSSRQIALGVRDCLDSAVEAVATRRLVPFLVVAARD